MDSKEFGLVFFHKLLGLDHLHYGYWDKEDPISLGGLVRAQEKYTSLLLATIDEQLKSIESPHILDVGCGTGAMLCRLLEKGYRVDGVSPSDYLVSIIKKRLAKVEKADHKNATRIFHSTFEAMPADKQEYDLILFSESFQYLNLRQAYPVLKAIVKPKGKIVICDVFKLTTERDPGLFGGGHLLSRFYDDLPKWGLRIVKDQDITPNMSPSIELLDKLMRERGTPALETLDQFLAARNPLTYGLARLVFRSQWKKLQQKYFAGHRTKSNFERYKCYRLLVLESNG